jgi:hypothetical protein
MTRVLTRALQCITTKNLAPWRDSNPGFVGGDDDHYMYNGQFYLSLILHFIKINNRASQTYLIAPREYFQYLAFFEIQ